jgi:hypothetical protein
VLPHRFKAGTSDAYFSYLLCGPQYWFLPDLPGSGLNLTNGRCAAGPLLCPPQNGQLSDSGVGDRGQIENKGTERQKNDESHRDCEQRFEVNDCAESLPIE